MAINRELAGKTYPPLPPYLVGREKVREFAYAVLAGMPIYTDPGAARAAGFSDVVAPPTFTAVVQERALQTLLADAEAGIDFSRVVHGDQRFDYSRPIVAGDELHSVLRITDVKLLGGHAMITSETTVRDSSGEHVVTATSTLVVRGADS